MSRACLRSWQRALAVGSTATLDGGEGGLWPSDNARVTSIELRWRKGLDAWVNVYCEE